PTWARTASAGSGNPRRRKLNAFKSKHRRLGSMDMASALAELGATDATIDARTRDQLDRDGYAPLPGVLSAAQLTAIRTRLAELLEAEGDQAGLEVHQENGADRLADLVNKGAMFDPCFTDPRLLACV